MDRPGTPAVTRNLAVGYLLPVPLHQPHRITANIIAGEGRALHVAATGTGTGDDGGLGEFGDALERLAHNGGHGMVTAQPKDDTQW